MVNTKGAQVLTPLTCQIRARGSWRPQDTTGTICSGAGLAQGHGPGPLSEPPSLRLRLVEDHAEKMYCDV